MDGGKKPGDISGCFTGQAFIKVPEIIQIIDVLISDDPQNAILAAVISCQNRRPVPENLVKFFQIGNGRRRGFYGIKTLVDIFVTFQTEFIPGGGDELPQTKGPGFR